MDAPTKLPGERMIRKGDVVEFTAAFRCIGNIPTSDTVSGYTLYLGCPIDPAVTGFTVTNESAAAIFIADGTRWNMTFNKNNQSYYMNGSIISYEYGILAITAHYPAQSSSQRNKIALLTLPSTTPSIFTFS